MSYEGYEQVICQNGHYFVRGAFDNSLCSCGVEDAWWNRVDDTNCDSCGLIPNETMNTFIVTPDVVETCNLGHSHITQHAVYRIPTRTETDPLRTYLDNSGRAQPLRPLKTG